VNALLDFSRLEAGRVEAVYEPVDLRALTRDLASGFRSAIERAGLTLSFQSDELTEPAFVDRGMWEKIVLNLLSNALKFTFQGGITVTLRQAADHYELAVGDTGVGIPEHELAQRLRALPARGGRPRENTRGLAASAWPWCRSWCGCTGARLR
jgi:signal transduction histidine kinase